MARGLARAAYWAGDFRRALPRWRAVLSLASGDAEAQTAVRALELLSRPTGRINARLASDDQPARLWEGALSAAVPLDPGTSLEAELSGIRLSSNELPAAETLGAARAGLRARLPGSAFTAAASLGLRGRAFLYAASAEAPAGKHGTLRLEVARDLALDSAPSFRARVSVTSGALSWRYARGEAQGAVEARGLAYGDGNAGLRAFGWALLPFARTASLTARAGAAVGWGDTRESRFVLAGVTSHLEGSVYRYDYRGVFDPYVTPERQLEGRLLMDATLKPSPRLSLRGSAEWGAGRERATGFGPATGTLPLPASAAPGSFPRTYHPWKTALEAELKLGETSLSLGVTRTSGAFYRVTQGTLALWRRF